MSYCVNCGVELDASAKKCALCGTKIINPNTDESEPEVTVSPFSDLAHIPAGVKTRFVAALISLIMSVPNMVCLLVNITLFSESFWSAHILALSLLLWIVFVLPLFKKQHRTYFMWAFDSLAVGLYTYFLMAYCELSHYFFTCALPIIGFISLSVLLYLIWVRHKKRSGILKALAVCAGIALTSLISGLLLSWQAELKYATEIGLIIFFCITAVVVFLAYCYGNKNMRRWLSKKLFT